MKRRKGLTIIEVLIAITLIGIVFVALASLQVSSLRVTTLASQDSQLFQEAVTEFETLRTIVLKDFRAFFLGCPENGVLVVVGEGDDEDVWHECPVKMKGQTKEHSFDYVITRVWADSTVEGGVVTEDPGTPAIDGLLRVTVQAARDDQALTFAQFVTCLDANQAPTISDRSLCVDPVAP